jgi:hypothetical protein
VTILRCVGASRTFRPAVRATVSGGSGGRSGTEHPLLALQRAAGNKAVAGWVQRQHKPMQFSKVALAPIEALYAGKCDAKLTGAAVRFTWMRVPDGKTKKVAFECGPQTFEFRTHYPWLGGQYPWAITCADDTTAWTTQEVEGALEDIAADYEDTGSKFWNGYHTIQNALADDLRGFCADQGQGA